MLCIELSDNEREALAEMLQQTLPKLEIEIEHTDTHGFKETLKQRRKLLSALLDRLQLAETASR